MQMALWKMGWSSWAASGSASVLVRVPVSNKWERATCASLLNRVWSLSRVLSPKSKNRRSPPRAPSVSVELSTRWTPLPPAPPPPHPSPPLVLRPSLVPPPPLVLPPPVPPPPVPLSPQTARREPTCTIRCHASRVLQAPTHLRR